MSTQVELVLRRRQSNDDFLSIFLEPTKIPLAARWITELKKTLQGAHFLEKDQCFSGFLASDDDRTQLCTELNRVAEVIRKFRAPGFWENGYAIPEICTAETLNHDLLNRFHHHFEILRGQVWNPSQYMQGITLEVSNALRKLNVLVHRLESVENSRAAWAREGRIYPYSSIHFLTPEMNTGLPLLDSDYEDFTFDEAFGSVTMHYCQIGKTHLQAWFDGDQDIADENINNIRYYSAGCAITWGDHQSKNQAPPGFLEWLRQKGAKLESNRPYFIDHRGNKQGLGHLLVAQVPLRQFGGRSVAEAQALLANHDDIYKIRVHEDGKIVEATFPLRLDEAEYDAKIVAAFPR